MAFYYHFLWKKTYLQVFVVLFNLLCGSWTWSHCTDSMYTCLRSESNASKPIQSRSDCVLLHFHLHKFGFPDTAHMFMVQKFLCLSLVSHKIRKQLKEGSVHTPWTEWDWPCGSTTIEPNAWCLVIKWNLNGKLFSIDATAAQELVCYWPASLDQFGVGRLAQRHQGSNFTA